MRGLGVLGALVLLLAVAGCATSGADRPADEPTQSAESREFGDLQMRIGCTFRENGGYLDVETADVVQGDCPFGDAVVSVTLFKNEDAYANAAAAQPVDGVHVSF
jgi:hypothetical protein